MTKDTKTAPQLLRVGRAFALTRAVDEKGVPEFLGATIYWS